MNFSTLFAGLIAPGVTPKDIRSEIYFLGSRHQGEALAGALAELKSGDLSARRARLMRAVVSHLKHDQERTDALLAARSADADAANIR